ncbi:hypothetical protein Vau01_008660 [Virgisporangium aurantiacum]|uniref:Uncharacterized protein n=1 Tax=Virgisporangium aurantiacum TaxID=175570 RepID=A0A8J4DWD7_9ACTN|nr:hypothetical protein Vau01_008660 [Virgisporangium aurantiacum]
MHLFTTLTLLVMAAGLWLAGPAVKPVPAPRLQVAEARVAAAENAIADEPAPAAPVEAETPAISSGSAPAAGSVAATPVALAPAAPLAATGPRAPPRA